MKQSKKIAIKLFDYAGNFAENKDTARTIRESFARPAIKENKTVIFDYSGVETTTQSFTHALISELIREFGHGVLDRIFFKNCNGTVKRIVGIVVEYMQQKIEE